MLRLKQNFEKVKIESRWYEVLRNYGVRALIISNIVLKLMKKQKYSWRCHKRRRFKLKLTSEH